jgi:starch-binding outer membrane protein, SusD/RagB family
MKNMFTKILRRFWGLFLVTSVCFSCSKQLDVAPQDALSISGYYQNVKDANSAIIGIYGQLYNIAPKYILWNELRADYMDVTTNADIYLQQLSTHSVGANNTDADPYPFYSIILNCNDVLYNFDLMLRGNKMTQSEYLKRYSDVASIRCWLYLQLAIHFGTIPYVTDPLVTLQELKDSANFPKLTREQVIDQCVSFMETKVGAGGIRSYFDVYNAASDDNMFNLYTGNFSEAAGFMYVNKYMIMGDLYLWQNNYEKAAYWYRELWRTQSGNMVKLKVNEYSYQASKNYWSSMFKYLNDGTQYLGYLSDEWIWMMYYDKSLNPNPLVDYFANFGANSYLLKPSQAAINNWTSLPDGIVGNDLRGQGCSWQYVNGQPVILKYLMDYLGLTTNSTANLNPITVSTNSSTNVTSVTLTNNTVSTSTVINPLNKGGRWFLSRAATLMLHYCEAANRARRPKLAWAFLNNGLIATIANNGYDNGLTDKTNTMATFDVAPYDFNARQGDNPYFRDEFCQTNGIRGRAASSARIMPSWVASTDDSISVVEKCLLDESGYELAFEGVRWGELVRISKRRNDPSILANAVYNKLLLSNNANAAAVKTRLLNETNWYLPFPAVSK